MDLDFEDGRAWMIGTAEFQASPRRGAAERQSPSATTLELHLHALHAVAGPPRQPSLPPHSIGSRESITSVIVVMLATLAIAAGLLMASLISAQA